MNLTKCFIFFSLFYYLIINSADSKCQQPFQCGNLGSLGFPLSRYNQPICGLFMVDCNSTSPRLQLGNGGTWYDILQKLSANKFRIRDPILKQNLNRSSCSSFRSLSLPSSPSSSLTISSTMLTLYECPNDSLGQRITLIDDYFSAGNYTMFKQCPGFTLYYRYPKDGSFNGELAIPQACSVVQLPFQPSPDWYQWESSWNGIFHILTAEFNIEWNVSNACLECHGRGGQCKTNRINEFQCTQELGNRKLKKVLVTGGVSVIAFSATSIIIFVLFLKKYILIPKWLRLGKAKTGKEKDIELFLKNNGNLAHKRYKYSDLKKMTNSFSKILGKGGYGCVYKGKLPDGCLVAVKILNDSKENGEEFMNEVASISRTSHINIVTLLGFCFEGSKRALIYEFMPNGSLDEFIQSSSASKGGLGWQNLFKIAVGIARGLEYLHQGCNMRILHFDIKPHNILLDKDMNPKISDFGLAKLCPNRSSIVSMLVARGTIGYIAPEVFCRNFGEVSHKSDVYSYGMMVLEIAGGRKNIDRGDVDHTSEIYFPQYFYKELEMDAEKDGLERIMNEDESHILKRKLIIVGLWCIQTDPRDRPSISKVVDMLEGKIEPLQVPPKPYLSSPPRSPPKFSTSESM